MSSTSPLAKLWKAECVGKEPFTHTLLRMLDYLAGHDTARCQWCLAFLVHLWQQAGRYHPCPTPSFLIVSDRPNASAILDPLFQAMEHDPLKQPSLPKNSSQLRLDIQAWIDLCRYVPRDVLVQWRFDPKYVKAREAFFGLEPMRTYQRRADPQFGVMTGITDQRTFSVTTALDRELFREDVLGDSQNPFRPPGIDRFGHAISNYCPVIGSLDSANWDRQLVSATFRHGYPVLFAPVLSMPQGPLPYRQEILHFVRCFTSAQQMCPSPFLRFDHLTSDPAGFEHCEIVRKHAHVLSPEYEFFLLESLRGLMSTLTQVLVWLKEDKVDDHDLAVLQASLYAGAVRGIAMGLECLRYQGHTLTEDRDNLLKMLDVIRNNRAPISKRDLQRKFPAYRKEMRDEALTELSSWNFVSQVDRLVRPVGWNEFLRSLSQSRMALS